VTQRASLLLALAFLLLAHASAVFRSEMLALLATALLGALLLWPLRRRAGLLLPGLLALAILLVSLQHNGLALLPLLLPPVVITGMLGLTFARSLRPGSMPLIERVVRALNDGQLPDPGVPAYARRLTLLWALLLLGLALINLLLALCAVPGGMLDALGVTPPLAVPLLWWSSFANLINYLLIGGFFVAEYAYRKRRFRHQSYRNFGDFITRVGRLGPAFWRDAGR
jgi:uncharacterized membrane protein